MKRTGLYVICVSSLAVSLGNVWLNFSGMSYIVMRIDKVMLLLKTMAQGMFS